MQNPNKRIEPLMQRLPTLLAYPLAASMLWMMLGLCVLRLGSNLPSLLGLLFEIGFWVMAYKLAVEALVNTAHGRFEPLGANDLMATDSEAWNQLVLLVLVKVAVLLVALWVGAVPALVLLGLAMLLMPAAVILLAIDGSLLHAINPLSWGALIGRLGASYFGAVAVLLGLGAVSLVLQWGLAVALPGNMELLPGSFISLYLLLAGYHLLGYLIHEHHQVLGLDVAPAVPRAVFANPLEDAAMSEAEALFAQGRPDAAADRLQYMFRGRGASDPLHDRYHQYLVAAGDHVRLARHAQEYACSLLAAGKDRRALALVVETLAVLPGFQSSLPGDVARLVAQAARTGQGQLAVSLAEGFEARFPGDEHLPQVVLAVAPLMAGKLGREQAAQARLQACLRQHGNHALAPALREALAEVEQMQLIAARAGAARA